MESALPGATMPPMPTPRTALILLLLLNAVGYVVALATGLVDPLPGLLNGSKTNAPLIIWAAQTVGVLLNRRAGTVLALLACTVSLAAAAFDGDLGAAGLGAGQVAIQLGIAAVTAVLWAALAVQLAGRRLREREAPPATA
jgi:hypothetical protein